MDNLIESAFAKISTGKGKLLEVINSPESIELLFRLTFYIDIKMKLILEVKNIHILSLLDGKQHEIYFICKINNELTFKIQIDLKDYKQVYSYFQKYIHEMKNENEKARKESIKFLMN